MNQLSPGIKELMSVKAFIHYHSSLQSNNKVFLCCWAAAVLFNVLFNVGLDMKESTMFKEGYDVLHKAPEVKN